MTELSKRILYDVSISIMSKDISQIIEPRAVTNMDKLETAEMCQNNDIQATSAVVQPIIPQYFSEVEMEMMLEQLKEKNINTFKPELLTSSIENLAWLGQFMGHFDKDKEKELYELYLSPKNMTNIKHNRRLAPDREFTRKFLIKLKEKSDS